jgi:GAF domain-containing protein
MADGPVKVVVDCATGGTKVIPLTAEEIAQREADAAQFAIEQAARQAEAQAKADAQESAKAKLAALGLSDVEIAALLG